MIAHLKHFLKLVRWFHELVVILPFAALYLVILYYVEEEGSSCSLSGFHFIVLCFAVQMLIATGCVLNDIMDWKIDQVNKPLTRTVGRVISLPAAKRIFGVMSLIILLLSVYICTYMFVEWAFICPAVYLLSVLYNVYLKRSPLFGNIVMGLLTAFIPLVILFFARECIALSPYQDKIRLLVWLYAWFPCLIIIPRELSLDISDMEGDRADGCRTLPLVIGEKKARSMVDAFIILIQLVSIVFMYLYPFLVFTFLTVDLLLLAYLYWFHRAHSRLELIRAGKFLWFIMILGLIGFALSVLL